MELQPDLSTDIELDRDVYPASSDAQLHARLMIRNESADPVTLTFPTGQIYDLEIHDGDGNVVYHWAQGKVFPRMATNVEIQFEKGYSITAPLTHLQPGRYVVQAWLTLEGPVRAYSGSARFELK